jgi:glutamyl-tRNA synthetase
VNGKTRFAPSPTGYLHEGHLLSALYVWAAAQKWDLSVHLRIEDHDQERSRPEHIAAIREDLQWLGFKWQSESLQSEHFDRFEKALKNLEAQNLVYPCYCSRGQLHAASAPHAGDGTVLYPGTCRNLSPAQRAAQTRRPAWRLKAPDRIYGVRDGVQGRYEENLARQCGDFIIRRSDGVYAYQLAVVTDDAEAGVTQVVRGRDLLSSTPRQLYLYELLGKQPPEYYHVPLLVAKDGRRLSKRDRDLDLGELQQRRSPEQIIGTLAFSAGLLDRDEPISAIELASIFRWDKVRADNIVI